MARFYNELAASVTPALASHYEFDLDCEPKYIYLPSKNELFFSGMSHFEL